MSSTTTATPRTQGRLNSVDLLRGIAMIGLVFVHSILYLTPHPEGDSVDVIYVFFVFVLGDVGAALFTALVGISFVLSMQSRKGLSNVTVIIGASVRGIFLLIVAMLISLLTTGPDSIFEWDVLALIAVASIVLALLRPLPTWALVVVAALLVALAPVVRGGLGYLQYWGGSLVPVAGIEPLGLLVEPAADYAPGLALSSAVTGIVATGWFPLLPWLAFPVIGMALGRQLVADRRRSALMWLGLGVVGILVGLSLALTAVNRGGSNAATDHWAALSFTPSSTSLFLVQLGLVLLVLGVTSLILDSRTAVGAWMTPIRLVSRYSLTVYALSYLYIYAIIHVADTLDPSRKHHYDITTTSGALLIGLVFVVALIPVLGWWDRRGGVGSLEWTMNNLRLRAGSNRG